MSHWADKGQAGFADALMQPTLPVPASVSAHASNASELRYAVYRNNVMSSLVDAVLDGFPTVTGLLGERYMRALAAEYVRARPPVSPVLVEYGHDFHQFIAEFPPLARLPWAADLACFEWLQRESQDAADFTAVAAEVMSGVDADGLADLQPLAHPSARLVCSEWPLLSIAECAQSGRPWNDNTRSPCRLLLIRPQMLVECHELSVGEVQFIAAMNGQNTLMDVAAAALKAQPALDIPGTLQRLVAIKALASFNNI